MSTAEKRIMRSPVPPWSGELGNALSVGELQLHLFELKTLAFCFALQAVRQHLALRGGGAARA
mgnify:FL=1